MNFLTEPPPRHDRATEVAPGVRRLVAPNAGPMTYHGTNSYFVDGEGGVAVIDPGPDDPAHVDRLLQQAGGTIHAILLTHGHHDHWGGLAALKAATGAPVYGWHEPFAPEARPDVSLEDGAMVGGLRALHTPGHAPDHLCFVHPNGTLFSADVVMGWSTTVVGGSGGDMAAYFASLDRLLATPSTLYLPGHGPAISAPLDYVAALREHRSAREAGILARLGTTPATLAALVAVLYPGLAPHLVPAAERNVLAHLEKLEVEGRAVPSASGWTAPG